MLIGKVIDSDVLSNKLAVTVFKMIYRLTFFGETRRTVLHFWLRRIFRRIFRQIKRTAIAAGSYHKSQRQDGQHWFKHMGPAQFRSNAVLIALPY